MNISYREFQPADFPKLYTAFVNSFSDYFVMFSPPEEQFRSRVFGKLNIQPDVSGLAWQGSEVASFVLHTINLYQGIRTAYNGGTGTIISARNQGIASKLYEYLLPNLMKTKAERILLEVIDKNTAGQKLYESLGFQFTRVLKCFALRKKLSQTITDNLEIRESTEWASDYERHQSFEPSFIDSSGQLLHNLKNEKILEAWINGELAGHLIYQPATGRISQLAVHPTFRNRGIGKSLIASCQQRSKADSITIMNIPEGEVGTIEALESVGFRNELDQFELEFII